MSKIIRKQDGAGGVREYTLRDMTAEAPAPRRDRKTEFKPDVPEGERRAEFIPGGFDFDYKGGLRRDEILKKSMDEAEEILSRARKEAESVIETARKNGYEDGFKEGYDKGVKEAAPLIETFSMLVRELTAVREDFYRIAEEEMIHLVVNVAREIIGEGLERDPSLVRNVIRNAVEQLKSREELNIKVNPRDLEEAEGYRPELAREVEDIDRVTFRGDPLITRGGAMVESNIGSIDARLQTQLDAVRESFTRALEESRAKAAGGGGTEKKDGSGADEQG
ncbi:MAG: FliH/SctL family protein [Candidatus Nitrospinota bacterium M3_3B_026]